MSSDFCYLATQRNKRMYVPVDMFYYVQLRKSKLAVIPEPADDLGGGVKILLRILRPLGHCPNPE